MLDSALAGRPKLVSPPGDTIVNILEQRELSIGEFAERVGLSETRAQQLIDGKRAIDRDLARRLAVALGATEKFWIAREYDYRAVVSPPKDMRVETITQLMAKLPVRDMQNWWTLK